MVFGSTNSYPSAFDEALSRPLVSPSQSTDHSVASASSRRSAATDKSSRRGKLPPQQTIEQPDPALLKSAFQEEKKTPPLSAFFSSKNTAQNEIHPKSKSSNPFDEGYTPPSLPTEDNKRRMQEVLELDRVDDIETALLRERHTEAQAITKDMRHIQEISRDLANIVNDQQMHIDDIEEDAHAIHDSAERGLTNLERAAQLFKNNNSRTDSFLKTLVAVVAIGGLLTVITILLLAFGHPF
mmetsp:Transcript_7130/g.10218  ORF Transcript_7130/g.10218 Transcript_7130/m.10218 type:complete len:240 (+) Transcript_7130:288-1007(+)|eukprot:CAMPEP_0184867926 /NCGR_PEP_ID=MMETSP0580-20130426/28353_1 /TAXON_ID=1118495 /ORGANISM="Dactyliosolen fragilissimus" /LENGTH=239 /DNA_ID=CAMNT_0027368459 /DNA_START=189 /DNA_END=908 /DNA_ORIENTATION=-